jgi:hypothetical protein
VTNRSRSAAIDSKAGHVKLGSASVLIECIVCKVVNFDQILNRRRLTELMIDSNANAERTTSAVR